jgi:exonuclease III
MHAIPLPHCESIERHMNIDPFTQQHAEILHTIKTLRRLSYGDIATNADQIAQLIVSMSDAITLYLAVDDHAFFRSAADAGENTPHADIGRLAHSYTKFAARWNAAQQLRSNEEGFRFDARIVLRRLQEWAQRSQPASLQADDMRSTASPSS